MTPDCFPSSWDRGAVSLSAAEAVVSAVSLGSVPSGDSSFPSAVGAQATSRTVRRSAVAKQRSLRDRSFDNFIFPGVLFSQKAGCRDHVGHIHGDHLHNGCNKYSLHKRVLSFFSLFLRKSPVFRWKRCYSKILESFLISSLMGPSAPAYQVVIPLSWVMNRVRIWVVKSLKFIKFPMSYRIFE